MSFSAKILFLSISISVITTYVHVLTSDSPLLHPVWMVLFNKLVLRKVHLCQVVSSLHHFIWDRVYSLFLVVSSAVYAKTYNLMAKRK